MNRNAKRLGAAAVVLLLVAGFAVYWFLIRDTSDEKLVDTLKSDTSTSSPGGTTAAPLVLDGQWKVQPGIVDDTGDQNTTAGYRVQEKFAGGVAKTTANGRTPDVSGSLTVQSQKVTAADITVDLTTLKSDEARRDAAIRSRGLESTKFPKATFALSGPVTLPKIQPGQLFTADATGKLTLHGVTRDVTFQLTGKQIGDQVLAAGEIPIKMADYRIDPPNVGGFVAVDDSGSLEFRLRLAKA